MAAISYNSNICGHSGASTYSTAHRAADSAWRFKNSKLYTRKGDYPFSITRTTEKTRINTSGYLETVASGDPAYTAMVGGGKIRGIRLEAARTNQAIYSDGMLTSWSSSACVASADATVTNMIGGSATKIAATTTGVSGHQSYISSLTADAYYCWSVYVKKGTSDTAKIRAVRQAGSEVNLEVDTTTSPPTYVNAGGSPASYGIEADGIDGWYRIWVVMLNNSVTGNGYSIIHSHKTAAATVEDEYTYYCCGQMELVPYADSKPSSYIPTEGSAEVRNTDLLEITTETPTIFAAADVGYSVYLHCYLTHSPTTTDDKYLLMAGKSDSSTYVAFRDRGVATEANSEPSAILDTGATRQDLEASGTIDIYDAWSKWAVSHELDSGLFYVNGNSIDPQVGSLPVMDPTIWTHFRVGRDIAQSAPCDDIIVEEIRVYPVAKGATELDGITT